jgi:hypothetical protein
VISGKKPLMIMVQSLRQKFFVVGRTSAGVPNGTKLRLAKLPEAEPLVAYPNVHDVVGTSAWPSAAEIACSFHHRIRERSVARFQTW